VSSCKPAKQYRRKIGVRSGPGSKSSSSNSITSNGARSSTCFRWSSRLRPRR
jgi:hypothetical protein